MANPVPEIMPEEVESLVRVMATGRSDYPNQINNVLCFPGFFRGLLDCRASGHRRDEDRRRPGHRVRGDPQGLHEEYIIPSVFNKKVALAVARGRAPLAAAVARRRRRLALSAVSHAFAELAKRTEEITPFLAVEVFERAQELERQGHDVVHLEFGNPTSRRPRSVAGGAVRPSGRAARSTRTASGSCRSAERSRSTTWRPTESRCRRTRCS